MSANVRCFICRNGRDRRHPCLHECEARNAPHIPGTIILRYSVEATALQAGMPAVQSHPPHSVELSKINVDVVSHRIARIIHLLHAPVAALAGDLECELAVAHARFAAVDVADLGDDLSAE